MDGRQKIRHAGIAERRRLPTSKVLLSAAEDETAGVADVAGAKTGKLCPLPCRVLAQEEVRPSLKG